MYLWKGLANLFSDELKSYEGKEKTHSDRICLAKQDMLSDFIEEYWKVVTAFSTNKWSNEGKYGAGIFHKELNNQSESVLFNNVLWLKTIKKDGALDYIIKIIKELISPDYSVPQDYNDTADHLFALWVIYVLTPLHDNELTPPSVLITLELSLLKLIHKASADIRDMVHKGKEYDYHFKRLDNSRKKKETDTNQKLIIDIYNVVQKDGKSQHKIAKEIHSKLAVDHLKPPSPDTIKRRLREAKLPPFG